MVHGVQEQATAGAIVNKLVNGTEEPIQASTQISQRSCSLLPSFHTTVSPSSKAHDGVTKIQIPFHIQRITDPIVSPPRSPVLDSPTTTCAPTTSEPISSEPSMPRKKKKKSKKKKLAKKSGPSPTCPILPSTEESTGKVSTLSSPASTCTAVYLGKFSPNDVALRPAEELAAENHPQEVIASDIERPDSPPSPARHAGSDRSSPQLSSTPPETEPELSATVPATPDNVPEVSPKDSFNPTTISWSSFEDQPNFYSWWNIHQHDREHLYWIHEDWSTVKVDISTLNREDDPSACYFCTECRQHSPDKLCWCPKCQKRIRWCCCLHYPSYCNYPGQKAAYQRYLRQFALDAETGFPGTPVSKTEKAPKSPDETEEAPSVSPDQVDTSTPAAPGVSEADEATKTPDKREEKEEAIRSPDERGEAPAVPASPAGTPPAAPAETELISPEPKKRRRKQWPRRKRKKIKFKKNQMTWSDDTSSPGPSPPQDPSPSQGMAVETLSLKHIPELTPTSSLSSTAWDAPKLFTPIGGVSGAVKEPDFLWEFTKDSSFVWKRKHPRVVRRMSWPVNHLGIDEKFVNSV
ncbi:hypothetical protein N7478_008168 [Penicillium angulare]|uniref:uncharacterized protein n=1 Tax=Penicillium angulare TaxID=116970 RepID=UPI002541C194|nr:uncharacterized protein N7478_008168 [Penicillium angulare]KAJ5273043.1 hypothetical protein N7478_008168 [Penicillium angulare]